jgi:hypothetical protein
MTNTIFGDEALIGDNKGNGKKRAVSFDLNVFKVPEFWDEGAGYDYETTTDLTTGESLYDIRPSNWYNRTSLSTWSTEGIYDTNPIIIGSQHFDNGNEDIKIDITEYVNNVLRNVNVDYGLGISFDIVYNDIITNTDQSVAFFTKYTQTFFEPYVESYFQDEIDDNRNSFIEQIYQNLYLYVTKGSNFYDLDQLPSVDILDSSKTPITGLTDLIPVKIKKGVYKITFGLTGVICDGKKFFYDKWKDLILDGISINDVYQKFIPKPYTSLYTVGENQTELQRYVVQYFGVKLNEKIKRGEKRKILVNIRSIDYPKNVLFDEVYYRIFIKEGKREMNVFEWVKLDKTNENSFFLDTYYMIPREYFMQIKGKTHTEEIFYKNDIQFEIVSEK